MNDPPKTSESQQRPDSTEGEPNYDQVTSWQDSLEDLLRHKVGNASFTAFLECNDKQSYLHFWQEINEFKQLPEDDQPQKASELFESYVSPTAPKRVILKYEIRNALLRALRPFSEATLTSDINSNIFDYAQTQIYDELTKYDMMKFCQSSLYKNLLHRSLPLDSITQWGNDFESMQSHPIGAELFGQFLTTDQGSRAPWLLWGEIQAYKTLNLDVTRMKDRANTLVLTYLTSGADLEVPIDNFIRWNILDRMQKKATADMFVDVEHEVKKTLLRDQYPRFVTSSTYLQFVQRIKDLKQADLIE